MQVNKKKASSNLIRQLRWSVAIILLATAILGILSFWDQLFLENRGRLVKVYWVHNCDCAFTWMKELTVYGFVVRSYELETLSYIRRSLNAPTDLHGCHIGSFDGYFVEGHVAPAALEQLAKEHPRGLGVVTQAAITQEAEQVHVIQDVRSPVILVGESQSVLWFIPDRSSLVQLNP